MNVFDTFAVTMASTAGVTDDSKLGFVQSLIEYYVNKFSCLCYNMYVCKVNKVNKHKKKV